MAAPPSKRSQVDIILPSQYFGTAHKLTPEQRLMVAVLDQVLDCLGEYRDTIDPLGRQLFEEARQWLLAKDTEWPYSFESICAALNLDPGAVLRNLRIEPQPDVRTPALGRDSRRSRMG